MKTVYEAYENGVRVGHAKVADTIHPTTKLVSSVRVDYDYRGKRYGSKLIDEICAQADEYGMDFRLYVARMDSTGLSSEALVEFYRRRGFEIVHSNQMMRRHKSLRHPPGDYEPGIFLAEDEYE